MKDQKADRSKMSSGCFAKMPEMMREMMSKGGGSCCPCAETAAEMMRKCCPVQAKKESPVEKQNQNAPK